LNKYIVVVFNIYYYYISLSLSLSYRISFWKHTDQKIKFFLSNFRNTHKRLNMRPILICAVLVTLMVGSMAMPMPQYLEEAVRQAQAMQLLPAYAVVDKTAPGIQVAYFKLGPNDRVDLANALGGAVPADVVASLESQVDAIGKNY